MKVLANITPSDEQLPIVSRNRPGVELIRGAAGSGKTTTALLRLRALRRSFLNRKQREERTQPIRILVLTYNRTLRGYIGALASQQIPDTDEIDLTVSTFGKWGMTLLDEPEILSDVQRKRRINSLGRGIALPEEFLMEEVEYVLGRFIPERLDDYLVARREGRGVSPRVGRRLRRQILEEVITPYCQWKNDQDMWDWNDLAVRLAEQSVGGPYDIIITDETQDFSANQIRAINNHLAEVHSLTFVVDTVQRIYARGFTWQEAGITVRSENSRRLSVNYRNTIEIARFAAPLLEGIPVDDDGTIPDFSKCERHGPLPLVLKGFYSEQVAFVVDHILGNIDLEEESVAFLHPLGWFRDLKPALDDAGLDYVYMTRRSEWPTSEVNIALSTLHSAKGLEYDHVIIIGLNAEVTQHGEEEEDDRLIKQRRLLAMGIGRARESVIVGYKPREASRLIHYFDPSTFEEVEL